MSEHRVRIEVDDQGVATVALDRPDKHNALDSAMFDALVAAADRLAGDRRVRAVVLYGEGKSFCSGLDITGLGGGEGGPGDLLAREDGRIANRAQRVAYDWSRLPAPVIAAITGNCFGGGLQIALGADIRYATPDARLSIMEVKWGLVPDMGITQSLPRLVGLDIAKELTFTGRLVSGSEAKDIGLVTHVVDDPLAAATDLAREIAGKSPHAVQAAKRLYEQTWASSDPAAALLLESKLQTELMGSPNQIEAVMAAREKRAPNFTDPV